jgi:hypothetical protein
MIQEKLTPLLDVDEQRQFWCGTRIIKMDNSNNTCLYILAYASWDSKSMLIVDITLGGSKEGYVYGGTLSIDPSLGKVVVTKRAFQHTLGEDLEGWYLVGDK